MTLGLIPFCEKLVDESRVEVDSFLVDYAGSLRVNPAPRHAEAIRVEAELRHDRDVVLVPTVVVAGDVAGLVEPGVAGSVGEAVPHAASRAVRGGGAFDLVRGSRCSPQKVVGEAVGITHLKWMLRNVADASDTASSARRHEGGGMTGAKQWRV